MGSTNKQNAPSSTLMNKEALDSLFRKSKNNFINFTNNNKCEMLSRTCILCLTICHKSRPQNLSGHVLANACDGLRQHFLQTLISFNCSYCSISFNNLFLLASHLFVFHGHKKVLCPKCCKNVTFNTLKAHVIGHLNETLSDPISCKQCSFVGIASLFLTHIVIFHKLKLVKITRTVVRRHVLGNKKLAELAILHSKTLYNNSL